ncbi:dynamin-related protein 3A-like isoform X3 [Trifolium pratense]|uniref:dynamin-related protein 3A-like isoform X3 n=1 Tax=Trifolium pratense TaxID=57577 RepID=UPI001E6980B8|nr:dynamin-related protein 3A-like isoform X3 [Trifolium pratense]XP_045817667.1 dynamin-related protein 3A-like isoform X3 [Trifolium pratense]
MADETVTSPPPPPSSAPPVPLGSGVISLVNRLQDIFSRVGSQTAINLPQVAVVGSQSSGKSSVLEALVGRDFLPRGNEICTRRPLVLQLVRSSEQADEFGEFLHLAGKRFYDFSDIRREIQAETDREAGDNKGVSDRQIRLKIVSPNVLDMTLVDLPGITKVPVGDQPSDIEARIRTMIMSYIKEPSCLILAVTPANSDLANSDALQMAGVADPDGNRTIGVITKLDIMDRGTDARNLLLGKVIPLRLGYVGVVNRSQEDIQMNRSIKDALVAEEKFFRSRPVYSGLADSCGIPQLAKKLNQILAQHIKALLPGLRAHISTNLVTVAKEHQSYGEITESKAGQGVLLLNILSKYCEAFSSLVEGKNKEMSTSELSGGARIHYIFQSIFVRSLEEVDPCEGLTDDDIRTAIQNATGPRSALFIPEVPFEVLVRRQISRLLDPSLQCARFIHDELIKMSRYCMKLVTELQRFPLLRKRMDEVIGIFLLEGLKPSTNVIGHIIDMEMDYINTSHPNFIGGSKALDIAMQQSRSSRAALSVSRPKDVLESDKGSASERSVKSRAILGRQANGVVADPGVRAVSDAEKVAASGNTGGSSWGISSIFGGGDKSAKENVASKQYAEPFHSVDSVEQSFSMIHLTEPPPILRPSDCNSDSETEAVEIMVTKLLLKSYYDIVRKNIEDIVPKTIMHFLVNNTKRGLHNNVIKKLYRDNLLEEMFQEPDEIALKRKRCIELLEAYRQASKDLEELPMEAETLERGYNLPERSGLPKIHGLPTLSMYSTSSSGEYYGASPKHPKSKRSSHSGELQSPFYANANSNGNGKQSFYPTLDT